MRLPLVASVDVRAVGSARQREQLLRLIPSARAERGRRRGGEVILRALVGHLPRSGDPIAKIGFVTLDRLDHQTIVLRTSTVCATVRGSEIALDLGLGPPTVTHRTVLEMAWPLALAPLGLYRMHAGAVQDDHGMGSLLVGVSGVGKSTSTLALAAAGWRYAADDVAYLRAGDSGDVVAHGWTEPVRLSAVSAASLGVVRHTTSTTEKSDVVLDEYLAARRINSMPVHRLLFPELGPRTGTYPIPASEALARMIHVSPWLAYLPGVVQPYLSCLARTAALPAARLVLGPELLGNQALLAEHLGSASRIEE